MERQFYPTLDQTISRCRKRQIPSERLAVIRELADYIFEKVRTGKEVRLNFICTHNSRRSQLSQIWAAVAAAYHGVAIRSFSGGTEVTAFNEKAVDALRRDGFRIKKEEDQDNPGYLVYFGEKSVPVRMFSKAFNDLANPQGEFAAVMTCGHAEENCPLIPGAELRIPMRFDDPKAFDGTDAETEMYSERSLQIGSELLEVFRMVSEKR